MENNELENVEKQEKKRLQNIRWIVLIFSILIFVLILKNLFNNEINTFDSNVYQDISLYIYPMTTNIVKAITNFGSVWIIVPIFIISIIIFRKEKISKYIAINLPMVFLLNQIIKNVIARPRPEGFRIVEEIGFSFPSAHSMISMAFYGFFLYIIYRKVQNKYIKWLSIIIISILIMAIGISRIYLGVHYASDVIGGFCIAIAYLSIYTKLIKDKI